MPKSDDFNSFGQDPVVKVVVDAAQIDSPDTRHLGIGDPRTDVRLDGEKIECSFDLFTESLWGFGTVFVPPG